VTGIGPAESASGPKPAPGAPPPSGRSRWSLVFKVAASAVLLGFLVRGLDFTRAVELLGAVDPWLLALAVLVLVAVPAVSVPRWRAILRCLGHALPLSVIARALYIGAFFNQVLPSSIGGDAWRIWFCTRAGVPLGTATNSVLIERLVGLLAVLLCFCLTFPLLLGRVGDDPVRWLLWLIFASCFAAVLGLAFIAISASRLERFRPFRPLAALGVAVASVARSSDVPLLLWTGILGQLVAIIAFYLINLSVGVPLSFIDCATTLPPGLLVALVPISLGGWGVREGALIVLLSFYDIRPEQALVVSSLFGLSLLAASTPGLLVWLGQPPPVSTNTGAAQQQ
jgi:uncharacterized membrane protein YbhN (UPF0104 family)